MSAPHGPCSSAVAQQVPGFLIYGVFGVGAVGGEEDLRLSASGGEGDDVPDFGGNDVSGDEVELVESVGKAVGINVALVGSVAVAAVGGLDLDAEEAGTPRLPPYGRSLGAGFTTRFFLDAFGAVVEDKADVVGQGVSPGTDEGEAEFGGAGHEKKLGPLALKFEVRESFSGH